MHETSQQSNPFLPLHSTFPAKQSDKQYVDKIAKSLQSWDRWRWFAILFHAGIVSGVIWFGYNAVNTIQKFQGMWDNNNQNALPQGLVLGIIIGLSLGYFLHSSVAGLLNALGGFRTERLLVEHFRQSNGHSGQADSTSFPETGK